MQGWVVILIAVVTAALISAKPLSRLRKPQKYDKLKICLSLSVILAAVVIVFGSRRAMSGGSVRYVRPISNLYRASGGAQCTVKHPHVGGYQKYVPPKDLLIGGTPEAMSASSTVMPPAPAPVPPNPPASMPPAPAPVSPTPLTSTPPAASPPVVTDVVVGGTLRLLGEF